MWSTMARMGFEVRFATIEAETFQEPRGLVVVVDADMVVWEKERRSDSVEGGKGSGVGWGERSAEKEEERGSE